MATLVSSNRVRLTARRASPGTGFWLVAYAFAVVMAFSALPTPLYVIYAARDGFSSLMITLIFATYVLGVVVSLLLAGHISDWYGRRTVLLPASALSALAGLVFLASSSVPALFAGRFLSGLAVGMVTTAATAHLGELHRKHRPDSSPSRPQIVAVAANLGGIGAGPLLAGLLAQFAPDPLRTPYVVAEALLVLALAALAVTPETAIGQSENIGYRPQRIAVPSGGRGRFALAALAGFICFAVFGLFTSLAPGILSTTFGQRSHALAGVVAFSVFAAASIAQVAARALDVRSTLAVGTAVLPAGLLLLAAGTWTTGLAIFAAGAVLTGAGAGLVFTGVLGMTIDSSPVQSRAEVLAAFFVAAYVGLAVPVVTLGILGRLVSARAELAGFAAAAIAVLIPTVARLITRHPATAGEF